MPKKKEKSGEFYVCYICGKRTKSSKTKKNIVCCGKEMFKLKGTLPA